MIHSYHPDSMENLTPFFTKGITFLCFSAPWCGTCRAVKRTMKEVDAKNLATIIEIDADQYKDMAQKYHVQGVPVILLLNNGTIIDRINGSVDFDEFKTWIEKNGVLKGQI